MDEHDPERREEKWQRATYVFNELVMASVNDMPEEYRANWQGDRLVLPRRRQSHPRRGTRQA